MDSKIQSRASEQGPQDKEPREHSRHDKPQKKRASKLEGGNDVETRCGKDVANDVETARTSGINKQYRMQGIEHNHGKLPEAEERNLQTVSHQWKIQSRRVPARLRANDPGNQQQEARHESARIKEYRYNHWASEKAQETRRRGQ